MKALLLRERNGNGSRIDLSMTECALSLLSFQLSATSMGARPMKTGNQHPTFAPVDVYPTKDGHVSIAVGNNAQWKLITGFPGFGSLRQEKYETNEGRKGNNELLTKELSAVTSHRTTDELIALFREARIPISCVNTLEDVLHDPFLKTKLIDIYDPITGIEVKIAPPAFRASSIDEISFSPRLGQNNNSILVALGYDVEELVRDGII